MLVLLDTETGKVITKNGISCIEDDPRGEMFPWRPSPFKEVIRGKLLTNNSDGETFGYVDALTELQGKITGLYFSAHWVSKTSTSKTPLTLFPHCFSDNLKIMNNLLK